MVRRFGKGLCRGCGVVLHSGNSRTQYRTGICRKCESKEGSERTKRRRLQYLRWLAEHHAELLTERQIDELYVKPT